MKTALAAPGYTDDPETALMLRVSRDEPGAYSELARAVGPRLFARFFRCFQDRQEAEDLTQEVLLRVFRSRLRYQPRARFATWLFHVTQNVARNALRARRKRAGLHLQAVQSTDESRLQNGDDGLEKDSPSRPLERRELAGAVRAAVAELGGRQRRALEMQQFQNRSYAEIASILDLTTKATKSLLYRARLHLRGHLTRFVDFSQ
jgi:RNA polymerase sigma-70 factor (ECF subfamily)